jgi:predicted secreted protein
MQKLKQWFYDNRQPLTVVGVIAFLAAVFDLGMTGLVFGLAGMAKAIESQGITIQISVGASPSSFVTIANVTSFKGPGGSASVIDVSNLSSVAKEKLMGLPDEGQFSLDLNYDPDAASHQALRTARAARTPCEFKINFTDVSPSTAVFSGYVLGFEIGGSVDQQVKASITIEVDGAIAWN